MGCYASAVFGAARMKEMNSSNGMIWYCRELQKTLKGDPWEIHRECKLEDD